MYNIIYLHVCNLPVLLVKCIIYIYIFRYDTSWREGRRVVELGVLADGLAGCKECGLPLQLSHTQGIRDCGLGSFLQVRCRNLWCGHVNVIPTGKRHGRIWDANTKLATGINKITIKFNKWIYTDTYNVHADKIFKQI